MSEFFKFLKDEFYYIPDEGDLVVDPKRLARWDLKEWSEFTGSIWIVPIVAICIYLFILFVAPQFISNAWKPRPVIASWNALLAVFSIIGSCITVTTLLQGPTGLISQDFFSSVCSHAHYGYGYTGLFVFLFIYSKVFELFDTYWLILGNNKIICLHWYHHITVLMYCWHSYSVRTSIGLWFIAMNYVVHGIMYSYFFLSQLGPTARRFISKFRTIITFLQLTQMFVGTFVCVYALSVEGCKANRLNAVFGLIMYASYFYLFLKFFLKSTPARLLKKTDAEAEKKTDTEAEKKTK